MYNYINRKNNTIQNISLFEMFFIKLLLSIFFLSLFFIQVNSFESLSFFNSFFTTPNEINTDEIRQYIIREIENNKRNIHSDKMKEIIDKEKKLKNKLTEKIKQNIKKQIDIEEENSKYVKYFEIIKEKNRKEIDESEEDKIIKFAEENL